MVERSVPGYRASLDLIAALAPPFLHTSPHLGYDLGCALGGSSMAMLAAVNNPNCRVIAVDNAAPMLRQMLRHTEERDETRITPLQADMQEVEFTAASLIVLHLTLQFIPVARRNRLLTRCGAALVPQGGLLLFEKTTATPLVAQAHLQFKANNGYSQLEITQKRQALEQVLTPESRAAHEERLRASGFSRVTCVFTALNFVGWLAQL